LDKNVGNANEQSIELVWQGEEMQKLRKLHKDGKYSNNLICSACYSGNGEILKLFEK